MFLSESIREKTDIYIYSYSDPHCNMPNNDLEWRTHFLRLGWYVSKTVFTWSGGPRSSGVSFCCFVPLRAWKQKKPTPLDRGPPLHVNRVLLLKLVKKGGVLDNKASQQDKKKILLLLPYSEALWVIKFGYPGIQQILVVKKSSVRTYILFMLVNVNCHTY